MAASGVGTINNAPATARDHRACSSRSLGPGADHEAVYGKTALACYGKAGFHPGSRHPASHDSQ